MAASQLRGLAVIQLLGFLFDRFGAPWVVGGSVASSLIGEPRSTIDVDMAVRLGHIHIGELVDELPTEDYYADRATLIDAAKKYASANIIHYASATKVDIFFNGDSLLDRRQLERRTPVTTQGTEGPITLWVPSPEDQVLRKLWWYRLGGSVSDRQWRDVQGILALNANRLDLGYLVDTAHETGLYAQLRQAFLDAGVDN